MKVVVMIFMIWSSGYAKDIPDSQQHITAGGGDQESEQITTKKCCIDFDVPEHCLGHCTQVSSIEKEPVVCSKYAKQVKFCEQFPDATNNHSGCIMHAAFNISGNKELTWESLGICEINEYCDLKNAECKRGCTSSDNCMKKEFCNVRRKKCQKGEIVCGKLPETHFASGRIIGGQKAKPHQYPWMVKLGSAHNETCGKCGGTLISKRHVITAGHCVDETVQSHWKRSKVNYVTLGDHNCKAYDYGELIVAVKDYKLHPKYNLTTIKGTDANGEEKLDQVLYYDFAFITLTTSISFSSTILPACLPRNAQSDYEWAQAQTSGWGLLQNYDFEGRRTKPNELMTVNLTVLPESLCKNASEYESRLDKKYFDSSQMLCVGSTEKDQKGIWQGDSGGPLIIRDNETLRYTLIGVASVAHGSLKNRTVVATYARVDRVLPWIYSFINEID